jgi:hypothetical protein
MKFILGTGYHKRDNADSVEFLRIWYRNLKRYCPPPDWIIAITTGQRFPLFWAEDVQWIRAANLGHADDPKDYLSGWSAAVLALAMIAYNCTADLVFLEQDCLAFGNWLETAYADMGERQMVFGHKQESEPFMPSSNSLFIIRHGFLREFVRRYLALPPDREMNAENKFVEIENQSPSDFARLSFGVDRCRPIPWEAPVFYAQRLTDDELAEARRRGLL